MNKIVEIRNTIYAGAGPEDRPLGYATVVEAHSSFTTSIPLRERKLYICSMFTNRAKTTGKYKQNYLVCFAVKNVLYPYNLRKLFHTVFPNNIIVFLDFYSVSHTVLAIIKYYTN